MTVDSIMRQLITIYAARCAGDELLPLYPDTASRQNAHAGDPRQLSLLRVGDLLIDASGTGVFSVTGQRLAKCADAHTRYCPYLRAIAPVQAGKIQFYIERSGYALAWICASDKGSVGEREDVGGPALAALLAQHLALRHSEGFFVPDETPALRGLVADLAYNQGYDLIIVTGGTGISPRDVTPDALLPLLERRLSGFEQAMLLAGLKITPRAAISRAVAGIINNAIVLAVPGSAKAARENLEAVAPALGHALEKLHGDMTDCG